MTPHTRYKFRLYVAGDGPNSAQAKANLLALCNEELAGRHEIEVVDVLLHPERALAEAVMLTPMLEKISPAPVRRLVGTLANREALRVTLGLKEVIK